MAYTERIAEKVRSNNTTKVLDILYFILFQDPVSITMGEQLAAGRKWNVDQSFVQNEKVIHIDAFCCISFFILSNKIFYAVTQQVFIHHCKANFDTTLDKALFSDINFLFSVFSLGESYARQQCRKLFSFWPKAHL